MSAPITTVSVQPAAKSSTFAATADFLLQRWHLLSLDAPTVAVVWTLAFAEISRVKLPPLAPMLLALATWLLYVADRLLDGFRLSTASALQERHYFHRRHRVVFVAVAVPSVALLSWLVAHRMNPARRFEDMLLATAAALYLLLVHLPRSWKFLRSQSVSRLHSRLYSKEAAVGMIFATACIIPAWSSAPAAHPWLLASGMLFAALCWLNCVSIDLWEGRGESEGESPGKSLPFRALPNNSLRTAGLSLAAVASAVGTLEIILHQRSFALLSLCVLASTMLLLRLDDQQARVAPVKLRALADAVLLTPILVLLCHLG